MKKSYSRRSKRPGLGPKKHEQKSGFCKFSNILQFLFVTVAILVCYCTFLTLNNIRADRHEILTKKIKEQKISQNLGITLNNAKKNVETEQQSIIDSQEASLEELHLHSSILEISALPSKPRRENDIHVVFSTDCGGYQNWQALVFFHSAVLVGHTAPITRIASGCSEEEQKSIQQHHDKYLTDQFKVHFTPDFSWDEKRKKRYPYYNKPYGILHWLENVPSPETIVALCDPDMIFMHPLSPFLNHSEILVSGPVKLDQVGTMVEEGKPVGQTYGFGGAWTKLDTAKICGKDSPCARVTNQEAAKYYAVGPPYIAHKRDWMKMASSWVEFVPQSFDQLPSLMAEMYAFCMAAAHHNLKHWRLDNYMVSNVGTGGEGWAFVNNIPNVCQTNGHQHNLPTFIHYCQRYWARDFLFAKRRFPKNFFTCDHPYLLEPPDDLQHATFAVTQEENKVLSPKDAKQNAFMVCNSLRVVNSALKSFKAVACPSEKQKNDVIQFSFANFK